LAENSVRHIETLKQMESLKHEFQIRCSHYELEFSSSDKHIGCTVCGKSWSFLEERGYSMLKEIYTADKE